MFAHTVRSIPAGAGVTAGGFGVRLMVSLEAGLVVGLVKVVFDVDTGFQIGVAGVIHERSKFACELNYGSGNKGKCV